MLTCTEFQGRLYDEDCRRSLSGLGPIPAELARHRDECADCRREWAEAADDVAHLPGLLLEAAPATVVRGVRIAVADRATAGSVLDWSDGLVWAAIGAAAALFVVGPISTWLPGLGPFSVSVTGASLAFAASATRNAMREALR